MKRSSFIQILGAVKQELSEVCVKMSPKIGMWTRKIGEDVKNNVLNE